MASVSILDDAISSSQASVVAVGDGRNGAGGDYNGGACVTISNTWIEPVGYDVINNGNLFHIPQERLMAKSAAFGNSCGVVHIFAINKESAATTTHVGYARVLWWYSDVDGFNSYVMQTETVNCPIVNVFTTNFLGKNVLRLTAVGANRVTFVSMGGL